MRIEALCDKAKDHCPDIWLANRIRVIAQRGGDRFSLTANPAEGLPYLRAAGAMPRDGMPRDLRAEFAAEAS